MKNRSTFQALVLTALFSLPAHAQFTELHNIQHADPTFSDRFGTSVAISGTIGIIGAPNHLHGPSRPGGAFLFDAVTGTQLFELFPAAPSPGDFFGWSVAIDGATAVVGALSDDVTTFDEGSVTLFDTSTGVAGFQLLPADLASSDFFGAAVGISGGTVVVGSQNHAHGGVVVIGAAYLFDVATGNELFELNPSDGGSGDLFGTAVAISGNRVVVGAADNGTVGLRAGAAYVYDASTGAQLFKLFPSSHSGLDQFGSSVAMTGGVGSEIVVVGSPGDDAFGQDWGSVYIFDANTGTQLARISLGLVNGSPSDGFGLSVAINSTHVLVGVPGESDNGKQSGAVYVFDLGTHAQLQKLLPSDGDANDVFGSTIGLGATHAIVGAQFNNDIAIHTGSAYFFEGPAAPCAPDFTGDGVLDIFDILDFLDAFNNADASADFTGDGNFDIFDILDFLDAFNTGCP